jgi:arsenate reductase
MAEKGIDIAGEQPKRWTTDMLEAVDVIVTMGCGDTCPILPGRRYEDWTLPDPAGQSLESVRPIRDEIEARVVALLAQLAAHQGSGG